MPQQHVLYAIISFICYFIICEAADTACSGAKPICDCQLKSKPVIVRCDNKGLTAVPPGIPENTTYLYLNQNALKEIQNGSFKTLGEVTRLFLTSSQITKFHNGSLDGMKKLQKLYLESNHLEDFPDICASVGGTLTVLNIEANNIKNKVIPDSYKKCKYLQSFVLTWNQYSKLTRPIFQALKSVKTLQGLKLNELGATDIAEDAFMGIPESLNALDLSGNRFSSSALAKALSKASLERLNSLLLYNSSFTKISKSDFSSVQLPRLDILHLDRSSSLEVIEPGSFDNFKKLSKLFLIGCPLKSIDGVLDSLTNLRILNISSTHKLTSWRPSTFDNLTLLQELYLHDNALTTIGGLRGTINPLPVVRRKSFSRLALGGNPFNCTCELKWLVEFLKSPDGSKVTDATNLTCATPENLNGTFLVKFTPGNCDGSSTGGINIPVWAMSVIISGTGLIVLVVVIGTLFYCRYRRRGAQAVPQHDDTEDLVPEDGEGFSGCCLELRMRCRNPPVPGSERIIRTDANVTEDI